MSANDIAPIIIKKKKVIAGGGHHGGAWKVAYADFVTAMMAFFMLMWLLNATTEKQRKGIADFFSPTIPVARISGGGDGSFGGDSVFTEETLARNGTGATQAHPTESNEAKGSTGTSAAEDASQEAGTFSEIEEMLSARSGESMVSEEAARHITTRVTDEGLIIEVFDLEGLPLFEAETVQPTNIMEEIVDVLASIFKLVKNEVAVNGHTKSYPIVLADNPVWDLSTRRAGHIRELLQKDGLPPGRLQRVTGFADRKPRVSNLTSVRNNRIEIILLRDRR